MIRKLLLTAAVLASLALTGAATVPASAADTGTECSAARHRYSVFYRASAQDDWQYGGGYNSRSAAEDRAAQLADLGYMTRVHTNHR